ncbi:MAG: hypothetical protein ABJB86_20435, partial [Bacteroidota bacterium]
KLKRKSQALFSRAINNTPLQFSAYRSYWNYKFSKSSQIKAASLTDKLHYIAEKPNYGAGVGHQLANWNAGYYFSRYYDLTFAHFPFSNEKWEALLGFGEKETSADSLLKDGSFKKVRLPRFNSDKEQDLKRIRNIIQSYSNKKVLFLLAQDQGYNRQCDTSAVLSEKFFSAASRKQNKLFYNTDNFNIAIHIRRGDVADMKKSDDSNWGQRWLNNDYYLAVLNRVLSALATKKEINIYLFSQGKKEDFPEFRNINNMHYCLDVNGYDSFLHLTYADLLISSKSSFSYKPALISKGIKICPANFWHAYPSTDDFILAADDGKFDEIKLLNMQQEAFSY